MQDTELTDVMIRIFNQRGSIALEKARFDIIKLQR